MLLFLAGSSICRAAFCNYTARSATFGMCTAFLAALSPMPLAFQLHTIVAFAVVVRMVLALGAFWLLARAGTDVSKNIVHLNTIEANTSGD